MTYPTYHIDRYREMNKGYEPRGLSSEENEQLKNFVGAASQKEKINAIFHELFQNYSAPIQDYVFCTLSGEQTNAELQRLRRFLEQGNYFNTHIMMGDEVTAFLRNKCKLQEVEQIKNKIFALAN